MVAPVDGVIECFAGDLLGQPLELFHIAARVYGKGFTVKPNIGQFRLYNFAAVFVERGAFVNRRVVSFPVEEAVVVCVGPSFPPQAISRIMTASNAAKQLKMVFFFIKESPLLCDDFCF